jgi:hypothetical protein
MVDTRTHARTHARMHTHAHARIHTLTLPSPHPVASWLLFASLHAHAIAASCRGKSRAVTRSVGQEGVPHNACAEGTAVRSVNMGMGRGSCVLLCSTFTRRVAPCNQAQAKILSPAADLSMLLNSFFQRGEGSSRPSASTISSHRRGAWLNCA